MAQVVVSKPLTFGSAMKERLASVAHTFELSLAVHRRVSEVINSGRSLDGSTVRKIAAALDRRPHQG